MKKFFIILLFLLLILLTSTLSGCAKHADELMKYINKTELTLTNLENIECSINTKDYSIFVIVQPTQTYTRITSGVNTHQEWVREGDGVYFKYIKDNNEPLVTENLEYTYYILTADTTAKFGKKYYINVGGEYVETDFAEGVYEQKTYTFKEFRTALLKSLELDEDDLPASAKEIKDGGTPNSIEYSHDGFDYNLNLTKWKSMSTGIDGYHVKTWQKTDADGDTMYYSYKYPWSFTTTEIPEIK